MFNIHLRGWRVVCTLLAIELSYLCGDPSTARVMSCQITILYIIYICKKTKTWNLFEPHVILFLLLLEHIGNIYQHDGKNMRHVQLPSTSKVNKRCFTLSSIPFANCPTEKMDKGPALHEIFKFREHDGFGAFLGTWWTWPWMLWQLWVTPFGHLLGMRCGGLQALDMFNWESLRLQQSSFNFTRYVPNILAPAKAAKGPNFADASSNWWCWTSDRIHVTCSPSGWFKDPVQLNHSEATKKI